MVFDGLVDPVEGVGHPHEERGHGWGQQPCHVLAPVVHLDLQGGQKQAKRDKNEAKFVTKMESHFHLQWIAKFLGASEVADGAELPRECIV